MCFEKKRCDNTKIATSTADRPEKVRVFIGTRCNKAAVGENHVYSQKIIDSKPALQRQMTDPAAKRETAHTGRRYDARWNRKPECVRRMVNISPQGSAACKDSAFFGIDADKFYR